MFKSLNHTRWGPQDSVQLPSKWLNSMVYGRFLDITIVHGDFVMVYQES